MLSNGDRLGVSRQGEQQWFSHFPPRIMHNEGAVYAYVEARIWPEGASCPKCGEKEGVGKLAGKSSRTGI